MKNENQISDAPIKDEMSKKFINKKFTSIVIALLFIGGAVSFFLPGSFNIWNKFQILSNNANLAASVNGEKITKSDLNSRINQTKETLKARGIDLTNEKILTEINKQTLDAMINEKVLLQNAKKEGIVASDDDVSAAYGKLVGQFKDKKEFKKELISRNLTEEGIKESIAKQMILNKYIEQNIDMKSIKATDQEINNLYKNYSANKKDAPNFENMRVQLEGEVKQQKLKAMILDMVERLKKDTDIKIFL